MNVAELIEELKKFDPTTIVVTTIDGEEVYDLTRVEISSIPWDYPVVMLHTELLED